MGGQRHGFHSLCYLCKSHLAPVNANEAFGTFSYRCTYRIELHFKNALHQSTEKAITNPQLLWHHFISVDTLRCNTRAGLNILKVKMGLQSQRGTRKPSRAPKTCRTQSNSSPWPWGPAGPGPSSHPFCQGSLLCPHHAQRAELSPLCRSRHAFSLNVLIPIAELQTSPTFEGQGYIFALVFAENVTSPSCEFSLCLTSRTERHRLAFCGCLTSLEGSNRDSGI